MTAPRSGFDRRLAAVQQALDGMTGKDGGGPRVAALDAHCMVAESAGSLTRYDYTLKSGSAVLRNAAPLRTPFRAVQQAAREDAALVAPADTADDAAAPGGGQWLIRAIRGGLSANGNFYPDAVLREAAPRFDGARVLVRADEDHLADRAKDVRNLIGRLARPRFVEGRDGAPGEIRAELQLMEPQGPIARKLREAWRRGMAGLMGFSIVAQARARVAQVGGLAVRIAERIERVESVDLIVEAGAGGALLELIEARGKHPRNQHDDNGKDTDMDLRSAMLALIEARLPEQAKVLDRSDGAAVLALYAEALAASGSAAAEMRAEATAEIAASGLPQAARKRLSARFAEAAHIAPGDAVRAIAEERAYLAAAAAGGQVTGLGGSARVTEGRDEKVKALFDALLDPADRSMTSLKEAYVQVTGDARVTGRVRACDAALMREALASGTLGEVLGDAITRRMLADYRQGSVYDVWRRVASAVPLADFRTQRRARWGGYGDLPKVAESAAYAALTTPGDEEVTYKPEKRGGTEEVTLETIKNDDAGAVMRIPSKLSRAAQRTLAKFVLDLLIDNPAMDYDSVKLFRASHGNLGAAALSATTLSAARVAMLKQTEKGSGDRLGIGPRSLLVPPDLEEAAANLFRRSTENDRTFVQSLALDVLPVWYWTDANDWYLAADPMDIPCIEVGFLDGNDEPELFVQDSPTAGSLFTHDKITWKIRHIYGGDVLDHRGLYKAAVA